MFYLNNAVNDKQQVDIFANCVNEWSDIYESSSDPFYITVADMNQDGRLELITSVIDGSGRYSNSNYYIINGKRGLIKLEREKDSGRFGCDIIYDVVYGDKEVVNVPVYCDKDNNIYYSIQKDFLRAEAGKSLESMVSLAVDNGIIKEECIAYKLFEYDKKSDKTKISYWNFNEEELSEEEYEEIADNMYPNMEKMEMTWKWHKATWSQIADMNQGELVQLLKELYGSFSIIPIDR